MYYKVKISGVFEHFWLVEKFPENQGLFVFLIISISDSVVLTCDQKVIFTLFYIKLNKPNSNIVKIDKAKFFERKGKKGDLSSSSNGREDKAAL